MDSKLSRRDLLQQSAAMSALAFAAVAMACGKEKKPLSCTDTTGLTEAELQVRATLAYMDNSTEPGKACSNCQQFQPAAPDACGGCKIVKGPINPNGYCKSFVAKLPA